MTCIKKSQLAFMTLALLALTASLPGMADTFFMNGDVPINGKLLRTDDKFYYIDIGGRPKQLPKKSITRVEENDKTGAFDLKAARERAARREQQITERTGLTKEQRDEISSLILALSSDDKVEVGNARRKLAEMCQEENVYAYIAEMVPSEAPHFIVELIRILTQVDPVRAKPLLLEFATYKEQNTRAQCLELLGLIRDTSSLTLMMRGMLDHEPVVRLAACTALTAIGAKEATPLLLDNFNHNDLRVQNFAHEALAVIWKAELGDKESFKTLEEWQGFWNAQSPAIVKTVNIEGLEPLVPPGTQYSQC